MTYYDLYMKSALKIIGPIILVSILAPLVLYVGLKIWGTWHDEWSGYNAMNYIGDGYCNIAVLPIFGEIHSYGVTYDEFGNETISTTMNDSLSFLSQAELEPGILGVLALVDSTGGSPSAGHLISTELRKSTLPNAAYIADSGNSAAYLIASGADTIIASPFADVGSIGVTMSYLDYSQQNADQGIAYISLSSGKFKDYGNPDKPLTEEERALLERDLAVWHEELVKQIATNRNLPVEEVATLANGSSLPAPLALDAKLIDAVGDKETVRIWFAKELNMAPEEVVFCE